MVGTATATGIGICAGAASGGVAGPPLAPNQLVNRSGAGVTVARPRATRRGNGVGICGAVGALLDPLGAAWRASCAARRAAFSAQHGPYCPRHCRLVHDPSGPGWW